jgi:branched-chain amino acid transport system substrate-binding protein
LIEGAIVWKTISCSILIGSMLCMPAARADEQPGVVKVGAILSLSGPGAPLGDAALNTLQLYVERINAKGGVLTRKLVLRHFDDASSARTAADIARSLTERDHDKPDHTDFVIGGMTTESSMAIMPVLQKAGIPFLSLGSGSRIVDPPHRLVFKIPPNERAAVRALLTDLKQRGHTRIALLAEDSEFGRECAKELRDQTGRNSLGRRTYGVSTELDLNYALNENDIAQKVARLTGVTGLNAIVVFGIGAWPALVTKKIRGSGIALPLYHTHAVATDEFIKLAGKDAEGVRAAATAIAVAGSLPAADPQHAVLSAFVAAYRERYGEPPSAYGAYAYDALMLAIEAIARVDTLNATELSRSLGLTRHYVGVTGIYEDSPGDVFGLSRTALRMLEIRDGAWRIAE